MLRYWDCKELWLDDASTNAEQPDVMGIHLEEYAKQGTSVMEVNQRETPVGMEQEESYGEEEAVFGTSIRAAIKTIKG